jgi:hypothetical protein
VDEQRTVAILLPTLTWSWNAEENVGLIPAQDRRSIGMESMRWQQLSAEAAHAELHAYPSPMRHVRTWNGIKHVIEPRSGTAPREQNRILEIHGLMGAIGEQLAMAWTAEQDAQRLVMTAGDRDELTTRLMLRANAELVGHFVLGATHSLANLVLRILLLNTAAATSLNSDCRATFPPGSDERSEWPTFGPSMARHLRRAARASKNESMIALAETVSTLRTGKAWDNLDGRRGMDYHRRRPQSVAHTAPRAGTVSTDGSTTTMVMVAPALEADADADLVHAVAVAALDDLAACMREVRRLLPDAVRSEGISYIYDFDPGE